MANNNKDMWQINIENLVLEASGKYGKQVIISVFQRYNATNFDDLSPCFYSDVFNDLELMVGND